MQPQIVTVGPLAAAVANNIATSQKHGGAFGFALNGALSTGFSATAICTAQAVAGAGPLTINGSLAVSGAAQLTNFGYVAITSAGNDSGITFTVAGQMVSPSGGIYSQIEVVTGANASVVVTTKLFWNVTSITASGAAAGNVSAGVNGAVVLDKTRRVLFTSAGDDSGITFTVTGTDWNNHPQSQTIAGGNATTAATTLDFATISSIVSSGSTASTVTVGTNGVASSRPVFLDPFDFAPSSIQVVVTGTVNYTVQTTLDNPNTQALGLAGVTWIDDSNFTTQTATKGGGYQYAPYLVRIVLNSGTGSVTMTVIQNANATAA